MAVSTTIVQIISPTSAIRDSTRRLNVLPTRIINRTSAPLKPDSPVMLPALSNCGFALLEFVI